MSTITEAWDVGDFDFLAKSRFRRVTNDEAKILDEAAAAMSLIELAARDYSPQGRPLYPDEQLKIVTILHSSLPHHPGGYSNRAQGLLSGLRERGVQLASYTRPGFYREIVDAHAAEPFPSDRVGQVSYQHLSSNYPRGRGEFRYMQEAIPEYRRVFERESPNVVHVRSTYQIALPATIAAHSLGIPVLYEVSGLWELVYEGRGEAGRAKRIERMEDVTVAAVDRIVTMNRSMASVLNSRADEPRSIGLVPNAVDPRRFAEVTPLEDIEKDAFAVGYIGSLVDYEGLSILLKAIDYLRKQGINYRAKIVGRGAEAKRLHQLAEDLSLGNLVHFTGPVPADQVVSHFNDVQIVVLPRVSTPATECVTPLKPFEAMAARRPLLVSDVGALKEVSQDERVAKTFRAGDHVDLARAIAELSSDRREQYRMTEAAFNVVTTDHSWALVSQMMQDELQSTAIRQPRLSFQPRTRAHRRGKFSLRAGHITAKK